MRKPDTPLPFGGTMRDRPSIDRYENKHDAPRVYITLPYDFALRLAVEDEETQAQLLDYIERAVNKMEAGTWRRSKEDKKR